jgi:hypothetical protein
MLPKIKKMLSIYLLTQFSLSLAEEIQFDSFETKQNYQEN